MVLSNVFHFSLLGRDPLLYCPNRTRVKIRPGNYLRYNTASQHVLKTGYSEDKVPADKIR